MRYHQLSDGTDSAQLPVCIVAVPIRCTGRAMADNDAYSHHTPAVEVMFNGVPIGDADVKLGRYDACGRTVRTEFTGTAVVYTDAGINGAIAKVCGGSITIRGHGLSGPLLDTHIKVDGIVSLIRPDDGKVFQLIGAMR